jgi:hypothetical protein
MGDGYNFIQLRDAILKLSRAVDWETAKKEWALTSVYEVAEPDTCLCGHFPIIEICGITNRVTGKSADVGNVCIKRFLGIRSDLIFAGLKRIQKDSTKALNADATVFFYERGALTEWEYRFLQNTMRKRKPSLAQMEQRQRINAKVLAAVERRGFRGPDG